MEMKEIKFYDDTLLGVKDEAGKVWLAVKKACLDIGLNQNQANAERKKITNELLFENQWKKLRVKFDSQVRETLFILEKFVPIWLAQISITPKMKKENPEAVKKLLKYQLEAADVLHKAFYETEEQKEALHDTLGLQGRLEGMQVQINNMENLIELQLEKLESVVDNMTLSTRQQEKILRAGRERVNLLLGGAHSTEYKKKARTYLANLWNNLKADLHCGSSYKDLNPKDFNIALDYIGSWEYNN
ncbi:phage antirepressor N-terminal domain-containing protein [uncultured Robinsoniella sp.]|uniref:phage antirepressor N-terminal domain-containing protein n=1 Tax=uncultured Robinsoniella sp. TaxID=904190 RepID=UPI00374F88AA